MAAALLKKQGYEVVGVHLYCYDEGPYCTAPEDRKMAVRIAKHLEIPLLVWDLRREYKDKVIKYFFAEYKAGRTPNPDVVCNREIKFGLFMEKARRELKVDYVATGHYARIGRYNDTKIQRYNEEEGKKENPYIDVSSKPERRAMYRLYRGIDESKDQSYFLYTLTQKQLEHILFPIGNYRKDAVRKMAKELGLPNYERRDSTGVCFIGPVPIAKFLREHLPSKTGPVVNAKGEVIGEHDGVWFFTEGQRHGFSAKGGSASGGKLILPLYVIGKDVATNTLIVGRGEESKAKKFLVENPHWISELRDTMKMRVEVRIRHLGKLMPATLESIDSKPLATCHNLLVTLAEPAFGVAPGQSAVFYRRGEVLGGGIIQKH